jgi:predicted metal-dependent phosphoesterase TrpH
MKQFKMDLHIHSCLSPCADLEMSPRSIVEKSLAKGLDGIALCDHNSAENVSAVLKAGAQLGLHVLPGIEINSVEEVHTLAIFDRKDQAVAMQEIVYQAFPGPIGRISLGIRLWSMSLMRSRVLMTKC